MNPLVYFWLFLKATLFSSGGMGNLPSLHADLMARGWASETMFVEALAVGQTAPGPTGLWVVSLGYLTNGLVGAILALFAVTIPPLLVLIIARMYRRVQHHLAVEGFVRGLSLAVVGVFVVVLSGFLARAGWDRRSLAIAIISLALGATRRVPLPLIFALAAIAGAVLF